MKSWISLLIVGLLLSLTSNSIAQEKPLQVVTTILPFKHFIEKVGGERVEVDVLVPPGASPHTYELRPSQLRQLAKADLFVMVGSGIEFERTWVPRILTLHKQIPVVDSSREVIRIQGDPHLWLSPTNIQALSKNIARGLIAIDPEHQNEYEQNEQRWIQQLESFRDSKKILMESIKAKKMMAFHSAWIYFCEDMGLEFIPIEKNEKEPGPRDIARLIDMARQHSIKTIFASPQLNSKSAQVIADEIDATLFGVDPLGEDPLQSFTSILEALERTNHE